MAANYKCQRCNAQWAPRIKEPVKCPRCQSFHWKDSDAPKREDKITNKK